MGSFASHVFSLMVGYLSETLAGNSWLIYLKKIE